MVLIVRRLGNFTGENERKMKIKLDYLWTVRMHAF
jgi:hypothetical protein